MTEKRREAKIIVLEKKYVWFFIGFASAVRNREYGPGSVGKRKSSILICLGMVFHKVRGGGRKQGICAGRHWEAKIIDLDMFRYGFP